MATVSLLVIHVLGKGLLGLTAAIIAGICRVRAGGLPDAVAAPADPGRPADELQEVSADDPIDDTRRTGAAAGGRGVT